MMRRNRLNVRENLVIRRGIVLQQLLHPSLFRLELLKLLVVQLLLSKLLLQFLLELLLGLLVLQLLFLRIRIQQVGRVDRPKIVFSLRKVYLFFEGIHQRIAVPELAVNDALLFEFELRFQIRNAHVLSARLAVHTHLSEIHIVVIRYSAALVSDSG